jgi:hypothetical protein
VSAAGLFASPLGFFIDGDFTSGKCTTAGDFSSPGELPPLTLGDLAHPNLPFFGRDFSTTGDSFKTSFLLLRRRLIWAFTLAELALVPLELSASLDEGVNDAVDKIVPLTN